MVLLVTVVTEELDEVWMKYPFANYIRSTADWQYCGEGVEHDTISIYNKIHTLLFWQNLLSSKHLYEGDLNLPKTQDITPRTQ